MNDWLTWENDGRFLASLAPGGCYGNYTHDPYLGHGHIPAITSFGSSEARDYFIQAQTQAKLARGAQRHADYLIERINKLVTATRKVRARKVLELLDYVNGVPDPGRAVLDRILEGLNQVRGDGDTTARSKDSGVSSEKGTEATNPLA